MGAGCKLRPSASTALSSHDIAVFMVSQGKQNTLALTLHRCTKLATLESPLPYANCPSRNETGRSGWGLNVVAFRPITRVRKCSQYWGPMLAGMRTNPLLASLEDIPAGRGSYKWGQSIEGPISLEREPSSQTFQSVHPSESLIQRSKQCHWVQNPARLVPLKWISHPQPQPCTQIIIHKLV